MTDTDILNNSERLMIELGDETFAVVTVAIVKKESDPGEVIAPAQVIATRPSYLQVLNVGEALNTGNARPFSGPEIFERL